MQCKPRTNKEKESVKLSHPESELQSQLDTPALQLDDDGVLEAGSARRTADDLRTRKSHGSFRAWQRILAALTRYAAMPELVSELHG